MGDIEKQFNDGIGAIYNLVNKNQLNGLIALGRKLVSVILPKEKEYKNMTGNTITSYAFGIYQNGKMIHFGTNNLPNPVTNKLKKGELFSGINYDGDYTDFRATIDTDGKYGEDTSYQFLREYRPNTRSFAMVITTGTEYSSYLENVRHLNVLSDSIDNIPDEFAKSFKPIQ